LSCCCLCALLSSNLSFRIYDFGENTREAITVFVTLNEHAFHANKTLLALHSGYFRDKLAEIEHQEEQKISLPEVNASQFAEFTCWARSYRWVPASIHGHLSCLGERYWQLGSFLKAPGFQNSAMDDVRTWCKGTTNEKWPACQDIDLIYRLTNHGAKLRKFAAASIAYRDPFEKHTEGEEKYKAWEELFKNWPALKADVAEAAEEDWSDTNPWDDENRERYMEKEISLNQLWEEHILARRTIDQIKEAAKDGCPRSMIELDHVTKGKKARKV
jgi:BTB/POZ domain